MTRNMTQEDKDIIKIIPIGGLGAIGNHMTVFEYKDDILVVDAGIMFPDENMPGIDFLIPDFSYIRKNKHRVKGVIITHGHEDHMGAVPFLLQEINVPIYATRITTGFIQSRLEERPAKGEPVFIEIKLREQFQIGKFIVEFIRVNHSIVDGVGLAIKTDVGTIIHTGDFKIDYSPLDGQVIDIARFAEYGESDVLLLMADSTNAVVEGYTKSESSLQKGIMDIFSSSNGRIIIASFASNIHRIQQVMDAAHKYNRKVTLSGATVQKNYEIAAELGYITAREGLMVDIKEAVNLPDKKQVVICTGSQGEPMSALSRMANGTHKHIRIGKRDTVVIAASIIPGKEKTVNNVVNSLLRKGAEVYYDQENIHASGHASVEELKLMISIVKPKFFMPIHGEYRHLKANAKIAESLSIKSSHIIVADNGDILTLSRKTFKKEGSIEIKNIFVDGTEIGDIESEVIKDRQTMSTDGILVITAAVSRKLLQGPPKVILKGLAGHKNEEIIKVVTGVVEEQMGKMLLQGTAEQEIIFTLKKKLDRLVFGFTRRNPLIEIQLLEI